MREALTIGVEDRGLAVEVTRLAVALQACVVALTAQRVGA